MRNKNKNRGQRGLENLIFERFVPLHSSMAQKKIDFKKSIFCYSLKCKNVSTAGKIKNYDIMVAFQRQDFSGSRNERQKFHRI